MVDEPRGKSAKGGTAAETAFGGEGRERTVQEVKARVRDAADSQKTRAADSLGEVAQALHETARNLGSHENSVTARYADMAAEQVERMAQFLRGSDWQEMAGDAERFARRQPALFLGGAMAAGFILARFLKSTGQPAASRMGTTAEAPSASTYAGVASSPYATTPAGEV